MENTFNDGNGNGRIMTPIRLEDIIDIYKQELERCSNSTIWNPNRSVIEDFGASIALFAEALGYYIDDSVEDDGTEDDDNYIDDAGATCQHDGVADDNITSTIGNVGIKYVDA